MVRGGVKKLDEVGQVGDERGGSALTAVVSCLGKGADAAAVHCYSPSSSASAFDIVDSILGMNKKVLCRERSM